MEEIWRDVYGYEGLYEVSNMGKVRSLHKYQHGRILKQRNAHGYRVVNLYKNGKQKIYLVHIVVMQAFDYRSRERRYSKELVVDHIDGDTANNNLDNLEWCTQKENLLRSIRKGNRGRMCRDINTGVIYKSVAEAARFMGTNTTSIKRVCDGERRAYKKHVFVYVGSKGSYKTRRTDGGKQ